MSKSPVAASLLATALFAAPLAARAEEPPPPPAPSVQITKAAPSWSGFEIASDDGDFSLRFLTQLQVDAYGFPGDDAGNAQFRVRRFRPGFKATVFGDYQLKWVVDLSDSKLSVLDASIEGGYCPELHWRLGKDKAPYSYDHLQSSTTTTFMELGPTAQLSGNRDIGLQLLGKLADGVVDYQLGFFDGAADNANVDVDVDDRFELGGRVTFKPFKPLGVPALADLALGVTGSWGKALGTAAAPNVASYKTTGRATWFKYAAGSDLAGTTVADGERSRVGGHLDWRVGPVGLFGEVVVSSQDLRLGDVTGSVSNVAWQAYASVLLTGERSTRSGVVPAVAFDPRVGGWGALELAVRYGELTVDDAAFDDGFASADASAKKLGTLTVGLNWYWNRVVKLQLNYERTSFEGGAAAGGDRATEDFLGGRLQFNF
ncbi:MAG: hypothetical protein KC635_17360 [Myxococcales bacterium]|nr:hypothetical protein [Myxococcales bacterium]MCB9737135.1 hypothetical protein [Deltaproteobacteria bacterium]